MGPTENPQKIAAIPIPAKPQYVRHTSVGTEYQCCDSPAVCSVDGTDYERCSCCGLCYRWLEDGNPEFFRLQEAP